MLISFQRTWGGFFNFSDLQNEKDYEGKESSSAR